MKMTRKKLWIGAKTTLATAAAATGILLASSPAHAAEVFSSKGECEWHAERIYANQGVHLQCVDMGNGTWELY